MTAVSWRAFSTIEQQINSDEKYAQESFDKDMEQSRKKLGVELYRINQRVQIEMAYQEKAVSHAQAAYDAATNALRDVESRMDQVRTVDQAAEAEQDARQSDVNHFLPRK